MADKPVVAVCFGGPSIEHDVSILTGLQILEAIDSDRYATLPVYIDPEGRWYVGEGLRERQNYLPSESLRRRLHRVVPEFGAPQPQLRRLPDHWRARWRTVRYPFDIAVPAVHGTVGEDGGLQGVFEAADIPYLGARVRAAALGMDKAAAKHYLRALGLPVLDDVTLERPPQGRYLPPASLEGVLAELPGPWCVKPRHLGSSVGVHTARDLSEVSTALNDIFQLDHAALVEPLIQPLEEYNLAVTRAAPEGIRASAIERPLRQSELLDFRDKYLSSGSLDSKLSQALSEGMASATRVLHPEELSDTEADALRDWGCRAFEALDCHGTARIDFLRDGRDGSFWLNEINTFPGSLSYYLWEASDPPWLFTDLLTALIEEGRTVHRLRRSVRDPRVGQSNIFPRRAG